MSNGRTAQTITLDELIGTGSRATIKAFKELEIDRRFNPRIWVGIWIEPYGPGNIDIGPGGPTGPAG